METKYSNIQFLEYFFNKKGQHFITVMIKVNGKKQVIGRVYREHNKETGRTNYSATDSLGNPVYKDAKSLYEIKHGFSRDGRTLAEMLPSNPEHDSRDSDDPRSEKQSRGNSRDMEPEELETENPEELSDRDQELEDIRDSKEDRELEQDYDMERD